MLKNVTGISRVYSLRPTPVLQLVAVGIFALSAGSLGHYIDAGRKAAAPVLQAAVEQASAALPTQAIAQAHNAAVAAINTKPEIASREVELDDGQTFAELLADSGVPDEDSAAAMTALSKVYDLRRMRAGQSIILTFRQSAQSETLVSANFLPEATKEVTISRGADNSFTAEQKAVPVVRQRLAATGEIRTSLYEAGDRVGVPHAIMAALMHIYAHDIDFQRDIQPGDHFKVLYDQPMTPQGKAVGEGSIIYASLNVGDKDHAVYRVTFNDNTSDYFDDSGRSVRRALLRTPVAAAHVTSGFGMRMHPLLGYSKMHKGVDFGAPIGTPIFAAGTGTVEEIGFKNGYGRYIRIRHTGQMGTAYAHMSRFSSNLYRGSHVNQGQVIGYVGMSGRATGPHLHFEVLQAGRQVNPMAVKMPSGRVLDGKLLVAFKQGKTKIDQEFAKQLTQKNPGMVLKVSVPVSATSSEQATSCGSKQGC